MIHRTTEEQAAWAGETFDVNAPGKAFVLIYSRGCYFGDVTQLPKARRIAQQERAARLISIEHPSSRIQFIAGALTPRARKAT